MIFDNLFQDLSEQQIFFTPWTKREEKKGWIKWRPMIKQSDDMEKLHRRFAYHLYILEREAKIDYSSALGGRRGTNRYISLAKHRRWFGVVKKKEPRAPHWFYSIDVRGAFGGVNMDMLTELLHRLDPTESTQSIRAFLHNYCEAKNGGLLQGTSSSMQLFNLFMAVYVDEPMRRLCAKHDIVYTRFVDDLLFSTDRVPGIGNVIAGDMRRVIRDANLILGEHKTERCNMKREEHFRVGGFTIDRKGNISLGREYLDYLTGLLNRIIRDGDMSGETHNFIRGSIATVKYLQRMKNRLNTRSRQSLTLYFKYRKMLRQR